MRKEEGGGGEEEEEGSVNGANVNGNSGRRCTAPKRVRREGFFKLFLAVPGFCSSPCLPFFTTPSHTRARAKDWRG